MSSAQNYTALIAPPYRNAVLHPVAKSRVRLQADSPLRQQVIQSAKHMFQLARERNVPIIHVRIAFRPDFADLITNAPIFKNVAAIQACVEGSWGTQYYPDLQPLDSPHEFASSEERRGGKAGRAARKQAT